jgi:hypothetical protein
MGRGTTRFFSEWRRGRPQALAVVAYPSTTCVAGGRKKEKFVPLPFFSR